MVNKSQIQTGLAAYLDKELMPQLHLESWKQLAVGTVASIAVKRTADFIESYKDNSILKAMNIFDQNGDVDVDIIASELKNNIPDSGIEISVPVLGQIRIYKADVDCLYRMITGGVR